MPEQYFSERSRGDWSIDTLSLDAYFNRIGYTGPRTANEATLTAIYEAHLATVRFENFGIFLDGGVQVDLASIQEKIVFRGRGGYCYEQAQLLGAALDRLGFGVERLLARVGPDSDGPARPRTHLTLRVAADGGVWLADVGFGSSPPRPLSLRRHRSGGPQDIDGWIYEITPDEENGEEVWKLREYQAGTWTTLHRWNYAKVHPVDVVMSNHYTSTYPESWFTWQPMIVRRDAEAIRSILGRTYTVNHVGHAKKERRELSDEEFAAALTGEFAMPLSSEEVATLVAAPVGHDREPAVGIAPGT
jgi:N-hydroxyarylamine O-acetyltransferase